MARFCTKCGTPAASEREKFCAKCGAALPPSTMAASAAQPQTAQVSPPPAPPVASAASAPTTAAPAKSSGPWMKIIVGVLAFFLLIGVLGIATCFYVGYRVKQKVDQAKTEYGLDKIGNLPSGGAQGRDVCSLLSKEEVSEITGVAITAAEGSKEECAYSSATNPAAVQVRVTWQGGTMAFKIASGVSKMSAGGAPIIQNIPGIGDEAFTMSGMQGKDKESFQRDMKNDKSGMLKGMSNIMGGAPLMFRKGDVMVTVTDLEASGDTGDAKIAIAKKIASRL